MRRIIAIYAAVSTDGVFGVGNSLPWPSLSKDMEMFKKATVGHIVIMGRATFESLPEKYKPLPHRINIVISSSMEEGGHFLKNDPKKVFYVFKSIEEALTFAKTFPRSNIFFLGGREIWLGAIKYCNRAFITIVNLDCKFQPLKRGPLNFVHELLDPEIIFKKIGDKHYRIENSFSFNQEIFDSNKKVIDTIPLEFLVYNLKPMNSHWETFNENRKRK